MFLVPSFVQPSPIQSIICVRQRKNIGVHFNSKSFSKTADFELKCKSHPQEEPPLVFVIQRAKQLPRLAIVSVNLKHRTLTDSTIGRRGVGARGNGRIGSLGSGPQEGGGTVPQRSGWGGVGDHPRRGGERGAQERRGVGAEAGEHGYHHSVLGAQSL